MNGNTIDRRTESMLSETTATAVVTEETHGE
jgi:hypothetical protein